MKRSLQHFFYLIVISLLSFSITYAETSPVPQLQQTADKIISELQRHKANLTNNTTFAYYIVTKYLVPLVDQDAMAQGVLGRNAWRGATPSQKETFIKEFKTLVIHTYSAAIAQFTNERVQMLPIRGSLAGRSLITVRSKLIRPGKPSISIEYQMSLANSSWKVVDFSVDGISMVQSFRSQFAPQLSQGGVEGLIKSLKQHNARNA